MYCKNCGSKIDNEKTKFCSKCGMDITGEGGQESNNFYQENNNFYNPNVRYQQHILPPRESKFFFGGGAKFWFVLCTIFYICVSLLYIFLLLSDNYVIKGLRYVVEYNYGKFTLFLYFLLSVGGAGGFLDLLLKKRRADFYTICIVCFGTFLLNVFVMGFSISAIIGLVFTPGITFLILRKYWDYLG